MSESDNVLKVYCDKQKVMIADLVAKVLMLETKLEILEAQRKSDIDSMVSNSKRRKDEEEFDEEPEPPRSYNRLKEVSNSINNNNQINTESPSKKGRGSQLR